VSTASAKSNVLPSRLNPSNKESSVITSARNPTTSSGALEPFRTTHWTVVLGVARNGEPQGQEAMGKLCQMYWYPLYAFIRRRGHNVEDAKDLTGGFFAHFLSKNYLKGITVEGGKFRSFLLTLLKNFLADERERVQALKRGGGQTFISIDEDFEGNGPVLELEDDVTPADVYDLHWAQKVLDQALTRVRDDCIAKGKENLFDELQSCLTGAEDRLRYVELGTRLAMSENAIKHEVARLRETWRRFLKAEVATTVSSKEEIQSEIQYLKALISRHPRAIQIRAPKRPSN